MGENARVRRLCLRSFASLVGRTTRKGAVVDPQGRGCRTNRGGEIPSRVGLPIAGTVRALRWFASRLGRWPVGELGGGCTDLPRRDGSSRREARGGLLFRPDGMDRARHYPCPLFRCLLQGDI